MIIMIIMIIIIIIIIIINIIIVIVIVIVIAIVIVIIYTVPAPKGPPFHGTSEIFHNFKRVDCWNCLCQLDDSHIIEKVVWSDPSIVAPQIHIRGLPK